MAQIIDLHRTPTFIGQWPGDEPKFGDSLAPLFIAFQGAGMALADFVSGRDGVRGDLNLSEMGKVSKIAEVGRSMLDRIEKLKAVVTRFQGDVKTKETALQRAGAKASTDVPAALRQIEIREWFRSLAPEDRIASIARALVAEEADVYLINGRPVELIREVVADLRRRPRPSSIPLRFGIAAFVIARPTEREALEEFEHLKHLAEPDDLRELLKGVDPETVMFKTFAMAPRGLGTNGGTAAGLVGDFDTVARRIVEFTDAGIETFLLQFQPFQREMRLFANEIAPRVRALQGAEVEAFDDRAARA